MDVYDTKNHIKNKSNGFGQKKEQNTSSLSYILLIKSQSKTFFHLNCLLINNT